MLKKYVLALPLAAVAVCSMPGYAQTITAGVNGTVTDASGAVIPNAKVTATNVDTNVSISTVTTKDGIYVIRNLQIGQYKVTIESSGFAPKILGPFTLESGQDAKLDSQLGVEGTASSVSVNSDFAPLLNTENATLGSTLDTNAIAAMPLVGRNFTQLTLYVPGAVTGSPASFTANQSASVERNGNGTLASQNGNRQEANNFLLEGIDINETINNQLGYNPSPDAIGQMRVISANANAEFGNVGGGDIITLLKSGTNKYHGSAFFYLSNNNMDANSYANKHTAAGSQIAITPYTQTTFGGTFGGPIIKDKLFFFVDYEGIRLHSAGLGFASVATAAMRQGDFSELLNPVNAGGKAIQLYNTQAAGQPAYANNQLGAPTNPVARYLYAHPEYYPLPNRPFTPGGFITQNNYQAPTKQNRYDDQFDIKVNYNLSPKDNLSGSYSHAKAGDFSTPVLGISFPGVNVLPFQSFSFDEVHTFTPRLINDYNMGFSRIVALGANTSDPTGAFGLNGNSVVGLSGIAQPQNGFVAQTFTGSGNTGSLSTLGNSSTGTNYIDNTFSYTDTLTYQLARHTIKGGFQILRYQQNTFYPGNDGAMGHYDYTGQFTGQYGAGGFALADFNNNQIYTRAIGGVTGLTGQRQYRNSAFLQDDWKVSPTLTVNLGMRWEYDQPILEVNNKEANINTATKKVVLAGQNGNSRALYNGVWTNFMPRLGFAWNVTPKAVLRGGYGITTFFEGTGANLRLNFNYPFQSAFTATAAIPSTTSSGSPFNTSQGFGTTNTSCDITTSTTPCTTTIRAWDMNIKPMFLQEFSLTAEYQLSNTASVTLGYVGETGQHLVTAGAGNATQTPCVINGTPTDPNSTSAAVAAACPTPYANLVGQTGSVVFTNSNAMENYNSLQAVYRQRLSHGLELTANYTWARAMTNSTGFFGAQGTNGQSPYAQNYYNNHAEYGPAAQDIRNNLNGHLNYALPFGRGKHFGGNMNRVVDEVVGGWNVAMSALVYSGFPVSLTANTVSDTKNNSERPNFIRKMKVTGQTASKWFGTDPSATPCTSMNASNIGTCAYAQPNAGTFGTASVNSERAPGYQAADASVFKDFAIVEGQHISFRADAANVFNITSLGNPNNNTQSSTFGQITASRSQARQLQLSAKYVF